MLYPQHSPPVQPLAASRQAPREGNKVMPLNVSPAASAGQAAANTITATDSPAGASISAPAAGLTANPQSPAAAVPDIQAATSNQQSVTGTNLKSDNDRVQNRPVIRPLPPVKNLLKNLFSGNKD